MNTIQPKNQQTATWLQQYQTNFKPCTNGQHILETTKTGRIINVITIKEFMEKYT